MWNPFVALARRSRTQGLSETDLAILMHEENEVLDLFRRYHILYDAADIDGVLDLFTDDCVVVNMRGTYVGAEQIRKNYRYLMGRRHLVIHYGTNTLVRFEPGMEEAWLAAFFISVTIPLDGTAYCGGGTYLDRLRKCSGKWKIFEQRITINYTTDIVPAATSKFVNPPEPGLKQNVSDIIEPTVILRR